MGYSGQRGGRLYGAGEQVLRGPRRRRRREYHASHIDQELSRRHQDNCTTAAVP